MSAGPQSRPRAQAASGTKAGVARHAPYVMLKTSGAKHLALPRLLFGGFETNVKSAKTGFETRLQKYSQRATCTSHNPCCITSIRIFQLIPNLQQLGAHKTLYRGARLRFPPNRLHYPTPYSCDHPGATSLTDLD